MALQQILVSTATTRVSTGAAKAISTYALILSDTLALLLAATIATASHWLRSEEPASGIAPGLWESGMAESRVEILMLVLVVAITWFWLLGHYTRRRPFWHELAEILRVLVLLAAFDAVLLYITKLPFSRAWFIVAWLSAMGLVPLLRVIVKSGLLRFNLWQKPAIVLGIGRNALDAVAALRSEPLLGYEVVAFVTHTEVSPATPRSIQLPDRSIPVVHFDPGRIPNLREWGNPTVIVALEQADLDREACLIARLHRHCLDVHVVPPLRGLPLFGTQVHYFFRHELVFLTLGNNLARRGPRLVKRLFDVICAGTLILLGLPVLAYLAILIRRDGGSILFGHERIGHKGAPFRCLKFRTMIPNAQAVLDRVLASDPAARAEWHRDFKLRHDPRILPIGRLLRRYSLDELPQLWNVLKGEMSLVGPRPIVREELQRYGDDVEYYLETRPGMTGLWQISGRNDTGYGERVYLDSWYAKNWSLWMDIVILFKTVGVVLKYRGAY